MSPRIGIAGNDDRVMRLVDRLAQHSTDRRVPHFIEHHDVKESDRGGTLPDHDDLVDHHQLHHDPTVPRRASCPSIVGTCKPPARTDLFR